MSGRSYVFIGALAAAIVPAVLVTAQFHQAPGAAELGAATARAIVGAAPSLVSDAALLGFTTPVLFAGALAYLAPGRDERLASALAIFVCVVGWAAYFWMGVTLSDPLVDDAVMSILDEGGGEQATRKNFDYLANFATSARLVYLALGATLVGLKLRPAPAASGTAAAVMLLAAALAIPGEARAGQIATTGEANRFDVSVTLRDGPEEDPKPLPLVGGAFVYDYGAEIFAEGAYAEKTLVIEWTPKLEDEPALGVKRFTVEIPMLLRKWRVEDRRRIEAAPCVGVGQRALHDYEWMTEPARRWTRFLASLQQSAHYARRISASDPLAQRALNTAMSAFAEIAAGGWVLPPRGLRDRLRDSFAESLPKKHASLAEAVDNAESRIWLDLNVIEEKLAGESCATVAKTFDFLEARRSANERAYALQLARTPDLLDRKRAAALAACAAAP